MKLWIMYRNGIGFSKIIAEMLQDRLDDYIEVSVGNAKKVDAVFLVTEKLDYLILGDIISKEIPNLEIQNWLLKYWELSKQRKITLKGVSGFYVAFDEISVEPYWVEFLHKNVKAELIYPPILRLKLNKGKLALEYGANEIVRKYSEDYIEFLLDKKERQE